MRPSIRQLEYALAVQEHLNFHEAARACHVTQPALSAQVAQLEDTLGVRLFERDRRRVLVTPTGAEILARARRVMQEVDGLVDLAQVLVQPLAGTLRVGLIPTVAPYVLPKIMPALQQAYPHLRLLLREDRTETLVRDLAEGTLDLLLLALEADLGDIERMPLKRDAFVVAMSNDNALADKTRLRESDLDGQRVLLLEDGHCLRDQVLPICARGHATEVGDFRATSLHTLAQMTATGIGITFLPEIAVDTEARLEHLAIRPLRKPIPFRTLGLAWRRTSPRETEFRALGALIRKAL